MTHIDDNDDLVERARAYDPDAWEALYRRAYDMLFGYAFRRLGSVDASEDAVSETMTRAMRSIDRYVVTDRRIDAWLVGILRNVVHESWRDGARAQRDVGLPAAVPDAPAIEGLVAAEEACELRAAFDRLSADEQQLLELRVVLGLRADEVGELLDRSPGAVRMAQHRALGRLRSMLTGGVGDG